MHLRLLLPLIPLTAAHSFIIEPEEARRTKFGLDFQLKDGPCGAGKSEGDPKKATYRRGQKIDYSWPRNNHPGGFIRLSIVPFKDSDSQAAFDGNVFIISLNI